MNETINRKDLIVMKLLHYFITKRNYSPIILQGAEDEIWLENLDSDYKIVRIVSNYIHNDEQLDFDLFKTKKITDKIKKKTFSARPIYPVTEEMKMMQSMHGIWQSWHIC